MSGETRDDQAPAPADNELAQAVQYQLAGDTDRAAAIFRTILRTDPRHAVANYCLGMLLLQTDQAAQSLPLLLAALEESPQTPDYWLGYLEALLSSGQLDDAAATLATGRGMGLEGEQVDEFEQRLQARASNSSAHKPASQSSAAGQTNRTQRRNADRELRRQESAMQAMLKQGKLAQVFEIAHALTEQHPQRGLGWKVFGAILWQQSEGIDALSALQTAARLLPEDAEAHTNLGKALVKLKRFAEAETSLLAALTIQPDSSVAQLQLSAVYHEQGRYAEAIAVLRALVAQGDDSGKAGSDLRYTSLLFLLSRDPQVDGPALFEEHRRIGDIIEAKHRRSWPRHRNARDPDRCLKVGWVSGDLCEHPVASFIEPVLIQLQQRSSLQLHAYATNTQNDEITGRLRKLFVQWHSVNALSDAQLAKKITADGIDILIDLSGHTGFNRLGAFARKPAPVQVSWIGYAGTTGLQAMDYYLADHYFFPPGRFDALFTEKLVHMPANVPFQPHPAMPPVNRLPALGSGSLTFGSFNAAGKINTEVVALWSKLLHALPATRLILAGMPSAGEAQMLTEQFAGHGIARERVEAHLRGAMDEYLALHHRVDLCLDAFPYAGGTTTVHALLMGVPTLTFDGTTPAGRQGVAILGPLGLDAFVADNAHDFVAKGVYWASHLDELADLRASLRDRWLQSPFRRSERIADALEQAFGMMWRRWCEGLPAQPITM